MTNELEKIADEALSWMVCFAASSKMQFTYTNWRGETAKRYVQPFGMAFKSTEWHPEQQWVMRAHDLDKNAMREFAMRDMKDVVYAF